MCTVNVAYSVVRKCTAIRTGARIIQGKDGDGCGMVLRFKMGTGSFPGIRWPERGVYHPPPSSAGLRMV